MNQVGYMCHEVQGSILSSLDQIGYLLLRETTLRPQRNQHRAKTSPKLSVLPQSQPLQHCSRFGCICPFNLSLRKLIMNVSHLFIYIEKRFNEVKDLLHGQQSILPTPLVTAAWGFQNPHLHHMVPEIDTGPNNKLGVADTTMAFQSRKPGDT